MGGTMKIIKRVMRRFWRGVRDWCGDTAYERYLRCYAVRGNEFRRLTAQEFYVQQLNRRYSRPNRCC